MKNGGSKPEGISIFHDCIISFVKRVFTDHNFEIQTSINAYLVGISKKMWFKTAKKNNRQLSKEMLESTLTKEPFDTGLEYDTSEKRRLLQNVLKYLKPKCKEILMYWAGGYTMKEITQLLGISSEGMARKKKYTCFKELIKWLEDHPKLKAELHD